MQEIYEFILNRIASKSIEKHTGIDLLNKLKAQECQKDDIAVIGMAMRASKIKNTAEFWNVIISGNDVTGDLSEDRKNDAESYLNYKNRIDGKADKHEEAEFAKGAFLEDISGFDFNFFDMTPKQAELTDPNQRVFLETVFHAIEDSGYSPDSLKGSKTGVFVGFSNDPVSNYAGLINDIAPDLFQLSVTGNLPSIMSGRISYMLDLNGPSLLVDTACSSSLAAVHIACQSIKNNECELAIVGGVKISILPIFDENKIVGFESSDGKTKAFDNSADGAGFGEGSGVVILKPLKKALRDKDNIHAVIKGSAVNQDGTSVNIASPNPCAQTEVLCSAWQDAGINPSTLSYIEAHGTGTSIGDVVEIESLNKAFKRYTEKKHFCAIGSVKANIGHLYESAGILGLIKAIHVLKNKKIPKIANLSTPNSKIDFVDSALYINENLSDWSGNGEPMRCGVSAFGLSGTNCHVVLEEHIINASDMEASNQSLNIFVLSSKSMPSLNNYIKEFINLLKTKPEINIEDTCFTTALGRSNHSHRLAILAENTEDLLEKLLLAAAQGIANTKNKYIFYSVVSDTHNFSSREDITLSNSKIHSFITSGRKNEVLLEDLCRMYVNGAEIDWQRFYEGMNCKKVSLPVYPFDRKRCWLDVPSIYRKVSSKAKDTIFYNAAWRIDNLPIAEKAPYTGTVIVLKDQKGISAEILKKYKEDNCKVIEIDYSDNYLKLSDESYVVSGSAADYQKLFADIDHADNISIIHMSSIQDGKEILNLDELKASLEKGVLSLFRLIKSIKHLKRSCITLSMITDYANSVSGEEACIKPQNASIFGLGKVIAREYPDIKCRYIDIDDAATIENIFSELSGIVCPYPVAYRKGNRYSQIFESIDISSVSDSKISIKSDGVYIITGGTGGIGLEIAKFLASQNKINIAFINRTKIPEKDNWDEIIKQGASEKLINIINSVKEIEGFGANTLLYSADISDENRVKEIISELKARYHRINGVIHGAGLPGDSILELRDEKDFIKVISPKIYGTYLLDNLLKNEPLDFFIMFSSVASIFSSIGQGDYAAANCFMDSYSEYRNKAGRNTTSINWVAWKEVGMAKDSGFNIDTLFKAISTEKAISSFEAILNKSISNVLIGEVNYSLDTVDFLANNSLQLSPSIQENFESIKRISQSTRANSFEKTEVEKNVFIKPIGRDSNIYSEVEIKLGTLWGEMLGFSEIDVNADFYELGGDSIMAIRLINQISKQFGTNVNIGDLLNNTTVAELSSCIENTLKNK